MKKLLTTMICVVLPLVLHAKSGKDSMCEIGSERIFEFDLPTNSIVLTCFEIYDKDNGDVPSLVSMWIYDFAANSTNWIDPKLRLEIPSFTYSEDELAGKRIYNSDIYSKLSFKSQNDNLITSKVHCAIGNWDLDSISISTQMIRCEQDSGDVARYIVPVCSDDNKFSHICYYVFSDWNFASAYFDKTDPIFASKFENLKSRKIKGTPTRVSGQTPLE